MRIPRTNTASTTIPKTAMVCIICVTSPPD
jgi:hypothetical protein